MTWYVMVVVMVVGNSAPDVRVHGALMTKEECEDFRSKQLEGSAPVYSRAKCYPVKELPY